MKKTRRSRKRKNPQQQEQQQQEPFFSKAQKTQIQPKEEGVFFQTKLTIGEPNDIYEKEADAVANQVVNQNHRAAVQSSPTESVQRTTLATPKEDEKLATAEARLEKDKDIQEKPKLMKQEEEEAQPKLMKQEEEEAQPKLMKMEEEEAQPKLMKMEEEEAQPKLMKMEEEEAQPKLMKQEEEEAQPKLMKMEEEEAQPKLMKMEEEEAQPKLMKMEEEEAATSSKVASPSIEKKVEETKGKGANLDMETKEHMESAIGADLGEVNIHTGKAAEKMSDQLGAQAFTHGKDIYFNTGKFDPKSKKGKHLLAHELTHVVQQNKDKKKAKND